MFRQPSHTVVVHFADHATAEEVLRHGKTREKGLARTSNLEKPHSGSDPSLFCDWTAGTAGYDALYLTGWYTSTAQTGGGCLTVSSTSHPTAVALLNMFKPFQPRACSRDEAAKLAERLEAVLPIESVEKGQVTQLGADDVLLAAGPKCGSTWVQQILHGLRTGGNMDFVDIFDVIPLIEHRAVEGCEFSLDQPFKPKMFKTHRRYEDCPTSGKVVVLTREPNDAALSRYHYYRNWLFDGDALRVDEFIELLYIEKDRTTKIVGANAQQMQHLASWYPHRNEKNVLWLHYEDLKADLSKCVRLLSEFLGIGMGDEKLLNLVEHQATIDFMKQHDTKFDLNKFKLARNELAGLPRDAGLVKTQNSGQVRNGNVNESKRSFSVKTHKKLRKKWKELIKPVTGFDTYEEMRNAINKELGRSFH